MKKTLLFAGAVLIAAATFLSVSCSKPTLDTNTQTAVDNNMFENEFMRILPAINPITISRRYGRPVERIAGVKYPTIILKTDTTKVNWPRVIEINYGPGVVDSSDGKTRQGIIDISFDENWHLVGAVATVSFNGYYVSSALYNATITILHSAATVYKVSVVDGQCIGTGFTLSNYAASRVFTWTGGYDDSVPSHSQYTITGSASGTDRNKVNFTSKITSTLVKRNSCADLCEGVIDITPAGLADRTVSYGNGTCTTTATVTINGQDFTVNM